MALSFFPWQRQSKKIIKEWSGIDISRTKKYEEIVKAHLIDQIEKLQNVNFYIDGWKQVVEDKKQCENCTEFYINLIRNRATYLAMIYYLSLQHYEKVIHFDDIIDMAIQRINDSH